MSEFMRVLEVLFLAGVILLVIALVVGSAFLYWKVTASLLFAVAWGLAFLLSFCMLFGCGD